MAAALPDTGSSGPWFLAELGGVIPRQAQSRAALWSSVTTFTGSGPVAVQATPRRTRALTAFSTWLSTAVAKKNPSI